MRWYCARNILAVGLRQEGWDQYSPVVMRSAYNRCGWELVILQGYLLKDTSERSLFASK